MSDISNVPIDEAPNGKAPDQAADNTSTRTAPVAVQAPAGGTQALDIPNRVTSRATEVRAKGIVVHRTTRNEKLEDTFVEIVDCKRDGKEHPRYTLNDIGIAALFADAFREELRHVTERDKWYRYDGRKWSENNGVAMEYAKALTQELKYLADLLPSDDIGKYIKKIVDGWQKRSARETMLKDAATTYPISMEKFDADPFILNCLNGTLNLRNGNFTPHCADDLLSKVANVDYNPAADCPRWRQHIYEVMQGDADKAMFLQQAIGYALTGATNYSVTTSCMDL